MQQPSLTQEQLKERELVILQRYKLICEALDQAQVRWDDEATMTALAEILVRACVALGVKKQQFQQVMRDTWLRAKGDAQKQLLLRQALEASAKVPE